jgi:histone H3/H4
MPIGSGGRRQPPKFKDIGKSVGKATIKGKDVARAVSSKVKRTKIGKSSSSAPVTTSNSWEITLNNSDRRIQKQVKKVMKEKVKDKFVEILIETIQEFKLTLEEEIREAVLESDIYADLADKDGLGGELGITDDTLDLFESNIDKLFDIKLDKDSVQTSGGDDPKFTIAFNISPDPLPENLSDSSLGFAYYTGGGELKPWLAHLLYGDEDFNSGYQVKDAPGFGRTNLKIMIKTDGVDYSIQSDIAGSPNSHWVTETIVEIFPDLQQLFRATLVRNINKVFKAS